MENETMGRSDGLAWDRIGIGAGMGRLAFGHALVRAGKEDRMAMVIGGQS